MIQRRHQGSALRLCLEWRQTSSRRPAKVPLLGAGVNQAAAALAMPFNGQSYADNFARRTKATLSSQLISAPNGVQGHMAV